MSLYEFEISLGVNRQFDVYAFPNYFDTGETIYFTTLGYGEGRFSAGGGL